MPRRQAVSRGTLAALAAVVLAAAWLPAGARAKPSHASGLTFATIGATFSEPDRKTTYTVVGLKDDTSGADCCTYKWTLKLTAVDKDKPVDGDCDNDGNLSGTDPSFTWFHGNVDDPVRDDDCDHGKIGKYGHQGLITVVVSDGEGNSCTATYKGTLSSDVAKSNPLTADAASPAGCTHVDVAPKPKPCHCTLLTARILPRSLKIADHYELSEDKPKENQAKEDHSTLTFRVHWVLNCSAGTGHGCDGLVHLDHGSRPAFTGASLRGRIFCHSPCGQVDDGDFAMTVRYRDFTPADRRNRSFPLLLGRECGARELTPVRLVIHYNANGNPDPEKSKLQ